MSKFINIYIYIYITNIYIYRNTPKIYYRKLHAFLRVSYDNTIQDIKEIIKEQTINNKGISIQLDIWTSIDSYGYLGVIMNFINKNSVLDYRLIGILSLFTIVFI